MHHITLRHLAWALGGLALLLLGFPLLLHSGWNHFVAEVFALPEITFRGAFGLTLLLVGLALIFRLFAGGHGGSRHRRPLLPAPAKE